MVNVSVVIPTYNEEANIGKLLEALKPQMGPGDEIIIVDSHSADRTVEISKGFTDRIYSMPREGIGPAKNFGAEKAENEIVAFLDADGPPGPKWLATVRKAFQDPKVNGIAGLGLYTSDSASRAKTYNYFARLVFFLGRFWFGFSGTPWMPVNNCALRKSVLQAHGGYRDVVCEDLDFAQRAKGLEGIVYEKNMVVTLSDRRFIDEGFLNTVWLWVRSDLRIFRGRGIDSREYRATR
jgi:glycosyltransferase involved in cell wall biosynthesis